VRRPVVGHPRQRTDETTLVARRADLDRRVIEPRRRSGQRQEGRAMFTLEINGTALVVTNAAETEATGLFESEEFKEDLKTLSSDGRPLWDGKTPLTVRPASADEIEAFDAALTDDEYEDVSTDEDVTDDDDDPIDVVFLVEVDELDGGERNGAAT
jgi:hypothetical protein